MPAESMSRRRFLNSSAGLLATSAIGTVHANDGLPKVDRPRATDGDEKYQPTWNETLQITVGPGKADLVGTNDRVIQAAIDYVQRLGGGSVRLLPGKYTLRNSIYLPSNLRLIGSGPETVITKIDSETISITDDSDWYDQEITLAHSGNLKVGDGVTLQTTNPHNGSTEVIKRSLVAKSGNRFKLSDGLRKNLWISGKPTCSSIFPLFTSERTSDVTIENLTLDGNGKNNANLNGNYGGCIFLQDCNRYTIRNVETRNYNGDGISFQICHDVVVQNCHSHDNTSLGIHPGSGSQRPLIRNCVLERNDQGLFWCWGVKFGLAEGNRMIDNRKYGTSIGHNDTDNVMRNNEIAGSGRVGILFRDDNRGRDFWANRNLVENNRISNTGGADGIAIDIQGKTKDIRLINNKLIETRQPMNRTGIRIGNHAANVEMRGNSVTGFSMAVNDQRPTA